MTKKAFTEKLYDKYGKLNIQTRRRSEVFPFGKGGTQSIMVTKFFVGTWVHGKGFSKSPVHCGTWSELGFSEISDGSKF